VSAKSNQVERFS